MIRRIHIHNFRTFVNFEWAPPATSVLVGPNGAGKSAFAEALTMVQDLVVRGVAVEETWSPSARTAWLSEPNQKVEIDLDWEGKSLRYVLNIRASSDHKLALSEELRDDGALLYRSAEGKVELFGDDQPTATPRVVIPFDRRRSFISALEPRPDNTRIIAFRNAIAGIWLLKPDALRMAGVAAEESAYIKPDLSNFASWYRARVGEDPDAAEQFRSDLREAIAGFSALLLVQRSSDVRELVVRFEFGKKTHELGWGKLSDGQRLLIALYGVFRLGMANASLVVLDECENYLEPREVQPWFQALCDTTSERRQQLIVISHHAEAIDYVAADAAFRMWRDRSAGHTRIAPLEIAVEAGETAYEASKAAADRAGEPADGAP